MPSDVPIRCSCGTLRGVASAISGENGNRVVCYCDDCQAFAHFLGRADEILDERGGTEIFQLSPRHLRITHGADRLACMRLTAKGLVRWYTTCCRTPIGNTLATAQVPFVGVISFCFDPTVSRDQVLGPVRARVHGRWAKGGCNPEAHDGAPLAVILKMAGRLLLWRLRGDHRRSPLFDSRTGDPAATPRVLSADELREVRSKQGDRRQAASSRSIARSVS